MAKLNLYRVINTNARYAQGDVVQLSDDEAKKYKADIEPLPTAQSEQSKESSKAKKPDGKE